ncbi:MAG: hypothetical protein CSA09_01885 [Candidatus Contendobacter odensis]|uniref:Uncharacterized protein n=1 Tax=Candidatus Contendibacter odensensis TaxID=1400860 RepID=A0A2G6PGC9_9GAMM|nr:MAG: hypothetical protein CSA09_01885 [Candidatus Contendobacter odensis]
MPYINPEKLKQLLNQTLTYQGMPCRVIEILADELTLVLRDNTDRKVLQANQYGDAGDWLPQTFTVAVLNVRRDDLNPELPELTAFDLLG